MIRRVLSDSIGSANILRQRKWEASACESAVGSGAATPDLSAVTIFDKFREFNLRLM